MTISFSGLASGLDTSSWVESLVALKRAKVTKLETQKEEIVLSKDTLSSIKSFFASFRSTIEKITDSKFNMVSMDLFAQNIATSANLNVLTGSATTEAEEGTYNIKVDKLATSTKATSKYSYMTTIIETTTATSNSLLSHLGVNQGTIGVTVGGIKYGINIDATDTIATFIEKLKGIGVDASYNDTTGVFSMNIGASDIDDNGTNIINSFHLDGVNEGYETTTKLEIEHKETQYTIAADSTKLSELGVGAGEIKITANGTDYLYTITNSTTLGEFVSDLSDTNGMNLNASYTNGIFTLFDAKIEDTSSTGIIEKMKLQTDIYSKSQSSDDITVETVIVETTVATKETLLKDIGNGTAISNGDTVIVRNSNNELTTITVGTSTNIGTLLAEMTDAGLYAEIKDGIVEISGGTITGGSFDAVTALGLNSEPYTATAVGNPLTETIIEYKLVDYDTKLCEDLDVLDGYLEVTDTDGNINYLAIHTGQTIGDLMADLANYGIHSSLNTETGILSITGGAFRTLTDSEVSSLIASNTIAQVGGVTARGTDLLKCLYGADVIATDQIEVASAYSRTRALTYSVTTLSNATLDTKLGTLGLSANGTAIFNVRGDSRTLNLTTNMTVQDLMDELYAQGIESSWDADFSRITINNATLTGGSSNLADVLNLSTTISGKYVTSDALSTEKTINVDATRETTLGELGVSGNQTIVLNKENGTTYTFNVSNTTSLGSLIDTLNANGVTANLEDNIFSIDGGYITNTAVEDALGLHASILGYSNVLGTKITHTIITTATGDTTLGQLVTALNTTTSVAGGYTLAFNSNSLSVNANTTIDEVIMQIHNLGGSTSIDSSGRLHIEGGTLTGSVATALGFSSVSTTNSVAATGQTLTTITTIHADSTTKLSALNLGLSTITVQGTDGVAVGTITTNADMTIGDVLTALAGYGISGTIKDGVINLDSDIGNYATGGVLQSMGVGTASTTFTTTIGVANSSSSAISVQNTITANSSTTLNSLGLGASTITVSGIDGVAVGTITTNADMTIGDVLTALAGYGISGTIKDGVINLDSDIGNYATGGVLQSMGVGTVSSTFTTTMGVITTSSDAIVETNSGNITGSTELKDIVGVTIAAGGTTVEVKDTNGNKLGDITLYGNNTVDEMLTALAGHGISGVVNANNGSITLFSDEGNVVTGDLITQLGLTKTGQTVITTTTGVANTSTAAVTSTYSILADGSTKLSDLNIATGNLTIKDSNNNTVTTLEINTDTDINTLMSTLAGYGINADINNGIITLDSTNGNYITGDIATALGIDTVTVTQSVTNGVANTSSTAVIALTTASPTTSTTLGELIPSLTGEDVIDIINTQGDWVNSFAVNKDTTLGEFFMLLASNGITGFLADGDGTNQKIIVLQSEEGNYATGGVINELGLDDVGFIDITVTTGTTNTSSEAITYNSQLVTTTFTETTQNVSVQATATIPGTGGGTQTITVTNTIVTTEAVVGTETITVTHTFTINEAVTEGETITISTTVTTTEPVTQTTTHYVTTTTETTTGNMITQTLVTTVTQTIDVTAGSTIVVEAFADENTTFAQLGITDPSNLVVDIYWQGSISENGSYTLTADSTIKDFISIIEDHTSEEIAANIENGVITINNTEFIDWHVGGTLASALGISVVNEPSTNSSVSSTEQVTYTTSVTTLQTTTLTIDSSTTGYVTVQQFATEDTTLGELGITNTVDMELTVIGGFGSHSYGATTRLSTILSVIRYDSNYKLDAEIVNGVIKITSSDDSYYVQGTLADALGIRTVAETVTIQTRSSTAALSFTETIAVTGTSTVGEIYEQRGLTFRTTLAQNTIYTTNNGTTKTSTFTFTTTTTLDQIFEYLEGQGITGSIDENGVITLNSENGLYVGGYFFDQVLNTDAYRTISTIVVEPTTLVSRQAITYQAVATEDTTFAELGISGSNLVYELVRFQGGNFATIKVTMTADNTIGDFLKSIDDPISYGCTLSGSIENGKITITGTANANTCYYVQGALATTLGIPDTSESANSYTAVSSTTLRETSYQTLHWDTTVADLDTTMLYAVVQSNGQVFEVRNTGSSTVGEFLTELASYGFAVDLSNGKVSITNSENAFIGTSYLGGLALDNDDDASNGIVYANLQTVVTATSEPVYVNYYNTISTDDTLLDFSITSDQTITINSNGRNYTITIQPSDTFGDMFTQLASFGINASINDGILNFQTTGETTFVSNSAALTLLLKFGAITTSTTTISTTNTHSNNLVVDEVIEVNTGVIADEDTTLGELGLTTAEQLTIWDVEDGEVGENERTFSSTDKLSDVLQWMNIVPGAGSVTATLENGVITIENRNDVTIAGGLADALGIGLNADNTNTPSKVLCIPQTIETLTTVVTEQTATLNWDTTFAELGMDEDYAFSGQINNKSFSYRVDPKDTVGEVLTELASLGFRVKLEQGQVSIDGDNVQSLVFDDPIKTALNLGDITTTTTNDTSNSESNILLYDKSITVDSTGTITVTVAQTYTTQVPETTITEQVHTIITETTTGEFQEVEHTIYATITVTQTTTTPTEYTVYDTIEVDKVTLQEKIHTIVTSVTVNFPTTEDVTITITGTGTIDTLAMSVATTDVSKTLASDTQFSQLGITTDQTMTVVSGGTSYTLNIETTDTVGDMLTSLAGLGIYSSIDAGILTLTGDKDAYIVGTSEDLCNALGLNTTFFSTTIVNGASLAQSDNFSIISSNTLTTDDFLSEHGLTASDTITVSHNGNLYTVTVKTSDTVDDMLTQLASYGINGSVTDGKLTLSPTEGSYITAIGNDLKSVLKLADPSTNVTTETKTLNDTSNTLGYSTTEAMTTSSTFESLGMTDAGTVTVVSDGITYTVNVNKEHTVDDLLTTLAGYGISGSVSGGQITLQGDGQAYITGMSTEVATALKLNNGANKNYTTSNHTVEQAFATTGKTYSYSNTISTDDTFAELNLSTNETITLVSDGVAQTITVKATDTVDDLFTQLASHGITAYINEDNKVVLKGDNEAYVTAVSTNLANTLKLSAPYYSTTTHTTTTNSDSNKQSYTVTNSLTTDDTFAELNLGTGTITVVSNGTTSTINVGANDTVDDILTQLASYGITGNVDDGKLTLTGNENAYITGITDTLRTNLKLSTTNYSTTTHTATTNTDSNEQKQTITATATGTTQLQDLRNPSGNATTGYQLILSTESNAGNQTVTLNFSATDDVYDVIDKLAEYGLNASIDSTGRIAVNSSTLTDFDISGTLGTFLMGSYTKVYDEGNIYSVSDSLVQQTVVNMDDDTLLSKIGITNGNITLYKDGTEYTISIDNSKTIGDFRNQLAEYGVHSEVINGQLQLIADGVVYTTTPATGASNLVTKLGIQHSNWNLGDYSQESEELGDTQTIVQTATMGTKISELTDSSGDNLDIKEGTIYVYQDGTRSSVYIDTDDTIEDLASKLSQYGISVGISSEGKIYFDGNNNSYLTTDGIASGTASDILSKIGVLNNWSTRYNSTSETLDYDVEDDVKVDGSTRLVDLQDSSGNSLGITTGSYYVYQNGVRTTETITNDTTVDDFRATMATYGISTDFDESGALAVGGYNETYLATAATADDNTNAIDVLFEQWDFTNIYTSNNLDIPTNVTVAISETTKLADFNEGAAYVPGYITVIKDGVQTDIELTADDTVGDLMDELALYGFESVINGSGQLIIKNSGDSKLQAYSGTGTASNALSILGITINDWISTNTYESDTIGVTTTTTENVSASRETLLTDLEDSSGNNLGITTGEFYIWKDGVKYTSYISSDETLGSLIEKLESFGIETSLVSDGNKTTLSIEGSGNCYVATSPSTGASNVVDKLFDTDEDTENYSYTGLQQTSTIVTTYTSATEETLLKTYDKTNTSAGDLSVTIDGVTNTISIGENDTIGDVLNKFRALGLEATISDGDILIQSGYKDFTINNTGTSDLLVNLNLNFDEDLGGYVASDNTVKQTTTDITEQTLSVSNYANFSTQMKLLNISNGTLTIYRDGQKATLNIDSEQTFGDLRSQIATKFADVSIKFEDGILTFYSTNNNVNVEVGATTDESNFSAITGITSNGEGEVVSARELYCVNETSLITTAGLFRKGNVTEGTFVVGGATFTVDATTSLSSLISQINSSEQSQAIAFWDTVDGKFVITSRKTGAALVNIEAGTSNFTDIMGLTESTWKADGSVNVTKMKVETQECGENARFSINGTYYTSTSNTITSDVSRIKGVTINLKGVSEDGGTTTLKIERDKETVANAVSDIVDAYNELIANIDKEIAKEAPLNDQSALKLIRNQIRTIMTSSITGTNMYKNLSAVGISLDKATAGNINTDRIDVLNFDRNKFLESFDNDRFAVRNLLVGTETYDGIFVEVEEVVGKSLDGGYFSSAERSFNKQISRLDQKIKKANEEVERYKERLEAKFASMDLLISKMQNQFSSFLGS